MDQHRAYWNPNKVCWEISVTEPRGDRYETVHKEANTVYPMLIAKGINYVEASVESDRQQRLLIVNPSYWIDNENIINSWCDESNIKTYLNGMVLEFETQEDKLMFTLRWA